jgi:hypothetical protein
VAGSGAGTAHGVVMAGDENDPVQNTLVSTFAQALANLGWTLIYLV